MNHAIASLSWPEVSARRMERSSLSAPSPQAGSAEIVSALCGAHAQVLSAAELAVALRIEGATRSDVRTDLWDRRQVVKTYGPRGTVHLLTTADLPMWIGAFSSIPQSPSPFPKDVRMTEDQTEQVVAAIGKSLESAELTIDELTDAVVEATGPWAGDLVMEAFQGKWPRWRQAMTLAAHRGVLCFAPNRGRKVTYTNPLRYLSGISPLDGPTAQARLVQKYLHAYGPATPQNFAQWLNAPRGWAGNLFRSLAGEIQEVDFEGTTAWINAGDTTAPADTPRGLRLLPYFDAYVVAAQPRSLLYPGRAAERALTPSGQAGNYPVLMVDGTVAGVWHQRRSGRRIHVTVEPLKPLSAAQLAELDEQVERVATVLEGKPELTIGTVSVGGHA
ncbi:MULTISPECIES: winged helix DNA-binding domain-containing protein [Streptomyces]|uniref:Winged helix DNA-binding domain-containing protein n=3 Tax=Streptomyces TaxID=1883 RepID=A0A6B3QU50_STRTE|nr:MULTISPECIES: winged helix DNA-binding domain-containing protein [Streptomyces]MBQ0969401.1 AlkZ family DNA glycosylase [Streptomyces sp. RK74B]MZG15385.1 winged helix DNA-binding domain-containing protein [Streptomyces sp. SID5914]BET45116.1 winged helix DNA-binding domain-containing protein [Kitasatospora aureofaciens]MBQ1009065.1 AlkZ family DNA glycosylase [Streptomyces sp. RK23]NEV89965.1 winged helix DNA-binding domain-containing protein [Streptomyces tendae]